MTGGVATATATAAAAAAVGGGDADGPHQDVVTGAVALSSSGAMASPRGSTPSSSPRAAPSTSLVGSTASRAVLRGASRGAPRGRGGGRGRGRGRGNDQGVAAAGAKRTAAAGTSPTHRVLGSAGVTMESSTAGRKRSGSVDGETACADGGEDDGGGEKRCRTIANSERQEHARGISAPSLLHGHHPLPRQAQAGHRQVRWLWLAWFVLVLGLIAMCANPRTCIHCSN